MIDFCAITNSIAMRMIFRLRFLFSLTGIVGSYITNSWKQEIQKLVTKLWLFLLHHVSELVSEGKLSVMHSLSLGCKFTCQNLLLHPKSMLGGSTKSMHSIYTPPPPGNGNFSLALRLESLELTHTPPPPGNGNRTKDSVTDLLHLLRKTRKWSMTDNVWLHNHCLFAWSTGYRPRT